jgi:hypothetical protein
MAASTLSPLTENENRPVYSGLQATLYARLATQSCSSRRPQRAAEMGGLPPFAKLVVNA